MAVVRETALVSESLWNVPSSGRPGPDKLSSANWTALMRSTRKPQSRPHNTHTPLRWGRGTVRAIDNPQLYYLGEPLPISRVWVLIRLRSCGVELNTSWTLLKGRRNDSE